MYFPVTSGLFFQRAVAHIKAVDDVSFSVRKGETLGLHFAPQHAYFFDQNENRL
jgi:ABC-type oligopeptide transport system ATPase subunit